MILNLKTGIKMEDKFLKITIAQMKMILNKGYTFVLLSNGKLKKITKDDLYVNKADCDTLLKELKKV